MGKSIQTILRTEKHLDNLEAYNLSKYHKALADNIKTSALKCIEPGAKPFKNYQDAMKRLTVLRNNEFIEKMIHLKGEANELCTIISKFFEEITPDTQVELIKVSFYRRVDKFELALKNFKEAKEVLLQYINQSV